MKATTEKPYGKYEIVPTIEQLMALVEYYEKNVNKNGVIQVSMKKMLTSRVVSPYIKSVSYLNGVITYLANEGFIDKLFHQGVVKSGTLDVSNLLKHWDQVKTRDIVGSAYPSSKKKDKSVIVEVDVMSKKKPVKTNEPVKAEVVSTTQSVPNQKNEEILSTLNNSIIDMIGYLKELPTEMSTHLYSISNQLELTNPDVLEGLKNEKAQLETSLKDVTIHFETEKEKLAEQIQQLQNELTEAKARPSFDIENIARQRDNILKEVDNMLSVPGWTLRQNGASYRSNIEVLLNNILTELGLNSNN